MNGLRGWSGQQTDGPLLQGSSHWCYFCDNPSCDCFDHDDGEDGNGDVVNARVLSGAIFVMTLHVIALIVMMVRMKMVRMMLLMPGCYFCKNPSCDCLELDLRSSRRHITHILHDELQFNAIGSYY